MQIGLVNDPDDFSNTKFSVRHIPSINEMVVRVSDEVGNSAQMTLKIIICGPEKVALNQFIDPIFFGCDEGADVYISLPSP